MIKVDMSLEEIARCLFMIPSLDWLELFNVDYDIEQMKKGDTRLILLKNFIRDNLELALTSPYSYIRKWGQFVIKENENGKEEK